MTNFPNFSSAYNLDSISIDFVQEKIPYQKNELELIDQKWISRQSENIELFDGPLVRLIDFSIDDKIYLKFGLTSYKEYVGTREDDFSSKFGINHISKPVSVAVVLVSSDNFLLLGKRSKFLDSSSFRYSIVSGWIDPELDLLEGKIDLKNTLYREILEEINQENCNLEPIRCIGMFENPKFKQPVILFESKINRIFSEIQANFKPGEFDELLSISNSVESVNTFLKSNNLVSDILPSALSIFYKNKFIEQFS